ncbi:riboflavin synthase [Hyphobacterium marinum]|uniref:Riboflavin synthase n=1 Tax=Hyphobacterium marinum TaxID=3116574 RepID=A0ABU7LYP4_9PROT|nr:riboflavin synthase [Hyphobacterium sp. Y6023]MEE2566674.1 riboflavin synthase [Hyphobacterium sp. Y6023]
MFTGLVSAMGRVIAVEPGTRHHLTVSSPYPAASFETGCSICHAGACLTVTEFRAIEGGTAYSVEISPETLKATMLGALEEGDRINLERSLKVGDELGGHIVTGHVDGVGQVVDREDGGEWITFHIAASGDLSRYIARKGSIAVDGVSLTVNAVDGHVFSVMIIPHTAQATTLGEMQRGQAVNLEVDLMARYAARLAETAPSAPEAPR